jgi:hypothetical protein
VSRLDQFRSVPQEEAADASEEQGKPSGRGRPKAKAKAKARGRPGRPKGKAKARALGKATPKAKAKAKAKAHKEGGAGSQVKKTTRKRKAEEHQDQEEAAQQDAPVTPPSAAPAKTMQSMEARLSAPNQHPRAHPASARELPGVKLSALLAGTHLRVKEGSQNGRLSVKPTESIWLTSSPRPSTRTLQPRVSQVCVFFQQSCNFAYCTTSLHLECGVSGQVLEVLQGPKQRGYQGFHF